MKALIIDRVSPLVESGLKEYGVDVDVKILPGVDQCLAPGGIVICESETGLVLPAEVGGMTLKKQYKYGKVLLWKYGKPRQSAGEGDAE